jgi:hypothetical protein
LLDLIADVGIAEIEVGSFIGNAQLALRDILRHHTISVAFGATRTSGGWRTSQTWSRMTLSGHWQHRMLG